MRYSFASAARLSQSTNLIGLSIAILAFLQSACTSFEFHNPQSCPCALRSVKPARTRSSSNSSFLVMDGIKSITASVFFFFNNEYDA